MTARHQVVQLVCMTARHQSVAYVGKLMSQPGREHHRHRPRSPGGGPLKLGPLSGELGRIQTHTGT